MMLDVILKESILNQNRSSKAKKIFMNDIGGVKHFQANSTHMDRLQTGSLRYDVTFEI
jgi:hypothetical protein